MNSPAVLEMELQSDAQLLPMVRDKVREWLCPGGWTEQQTSEIVLAVDEALSNVIRHGYDCRLGCPILLSLRLVQDAHEGEGVEIQVRDFGRQVDLDCIRSRDLDDVRPGGLGVHLIRCMMSSAEYTHAEGGGMRLVMRKYKTHMVNTPNPQERRT